MRTAWTSIIAAMIVALLAAPCFGRDGLADATALRLFCDTPTIPVGVLQQANVEFRVELSASNEPLLNRVGHVDLVRADQWAFADGRLTAPPLQGSPSVVVESILVGPDGTGTLVTKEGHGDPEAAYNRDNGVVPSEVGEHYFAARLDTGNQNYLWSNVLAVKVVNSPAPFAYDSAPFVDGVNMATGDREVPLDMGGEGPALGRNPFGHRAPFGLTYYTARAKEGATDSPGYGSPGLSSGWVHNYDVTIRPSSAVALPDAWGPLTLQFANGAQNTLMPALGGNSVPTGAFGVPEGVPYTATGEIAVAPGHWNKVTISWRDFTDWEFTLVAEETAPNTNDTVPVLALTQITFRDNSWIKPKWSQGTTATTKRRLESITAPNLTTEISQGAEISLLSLSYRTDGTLETVSDSAMFATPADVAAYALANTYAFEDYDGGKRLKSVSWPHAPGAQPAKRTSFVYNALHKGNEHKPLLTDVQYFSETAQDDPWKTEGMAYEPTAEQPAQVRVAAPFGPSVPTLLRAAPELLTVAGPVVALATAQATGPSTTNGKIAFTVDAEGNQIHYGYKPGSDGTATLIDGKTQRTVETWKVATDARGRIVGEERPGRNRTAIKYDDRFTENPKITWYTGEDGLVSTTTYTANATVYEESSPHAPNANPRDYTCFRYVYADNPMCPQHASGLKNAASLVWRKFQTFWELDGGTWEARMLLLAENTFGTAYPAKGWVQQQLTLAPGSIQRSGNLQASYRVTSRKEVPVVTGAQTAAVSLDLQEAAAQKLRYTASQPDGSAFYLGVTLSEDMAEAIRLAADGHRVAWDGSDANSEPTVTLVTVCRTSSGHSRPTEAGNQGWVGVRDDGPRFRVALRVQPRHNVQPGANLRLTLNVAQNEAAPTDVHAVVLKDSMDSFADTEDGNALLFALCGLTNVPYAITYFTGRNDQGDPAVATTTGCMAGFVRVQSTYHSAMNPNYSGTKHRQVLEQKKYAISSMSVPEDEGTLIGRTSQPDLTVGRPPDITEYSAVNASRTWRRKIQADGKFAYTLSPMCPANVVDDEQARAWWERTYGYEKGRLDTETLPLVDGPDGVAPARGHKVYKYDADGNVTVVSTYGQGSDNANLANVGCFDTVHAKYDKNGNLLARRGNEIPAGADDMSLASMQARDVSKDETRKYDAKGRVIFSQSGRCDPSTATYEEPAPGLPYCRKTETLPGGRTIATRYDRAGRPDMVTETADLVTYTTTYTYWDNNAYTGAAGQIANGLLGEVHFPDGTWERYTYDARGRKVREDAKNAQNAAVRTTTFRYDDLDNVLHAECEGKTTDTYYDTTGVVTVKVVDGKTTSVAYSVDGDLLAIYHPMRAENGTNATTEERHAYDWLGRRTEYINTQGMKTTWGYDGVGNTTALTYGADGPAPETTLAAYDSLGRLLSQTDAKQVERTYTYTRLAYPQVLKVGGTEVQRVTYDDFERPLTMAAPHLGTITYDYRHAGMANVPRADDLLWHIKTTFRNADDTANLPEFVQTYDYDTDSTNSGKTPPRIGAVTKLELPQGAFRYQRDGRGRVLSVLNPWDNKAAWQYDGHNRVIQVQAGPVTAGVFSWRAKTVCTPGPIDGRITSLVNTRSTDGQASLDTSSYTGFVYDGREQLTDFATTLVGDMAGWSGTREYGYGESSGELKSEAFAAQSPANAYTYGYTYDHNLNPLRMPTELDGIGGAAIRRHNSRDQWTGYAVGATVYNRASVDGQGQRLPGEPGAPTTTITAGADPATGTAYSFAKYETNNQPDLPLFAYDTLGRPIVYKGRYQGYDYDSRLTHIWKPSILPTNATADMDFRAAYWPGGRRAWREERSGAGGALQRTYFIYDNASNLLAELNADGTATAATTWGPTGLVMRHTLNQTTEADNREVFYQFDPLGNVAQRVNATGNALSADVYDAWGNRLTGGAAGDPYGYKGRFGYYTDTTTGLILCTHRYYDPQAGRWLTRDPIGLGGGKNLYGYCADDPVGAVDAEGTSPGIPVIRVVYDPANDVFRDPDTDHQLLPVECPYDGYGHWLDLITGSILKSEMDQRYARYMAVEGAKELERKEIQRRFFLALPVAVVKAGVAAAYSQTTMGQIEQGISSVKAIGDLCKAENKWEYIKLGAIEKSTAFVESLNVFGADSPEEAADRLVNVVGVALIIDGGVSLGKGLFVKPPAEPMAASTNVTRRPSSFRKATVRDAWENAKDGPTGGKLCPTCGKEASVPPGGAPRDWDIDHQPAWSKRDLSDMTRKEVLDEYNRGTRLECPHCNRGRGNREVAP